MNQMTINFTY